MAPPSSLDIDFSPLQQRNKRVTLENIKAASLAESLDPPPDAAPAEYLDPPLVPSTRH